MHKLTRISQNKHAIINVQNSRSLDFCGLKKIRLQKSRKGMELPISMIVILILSILVFTFGITMVFKFFKGATEASAQIDKATQDQINAILREGNELVAVPKSLATARTGQDATFAIGIRNIEESGLFNIVLGFAGAYTPDDQLIPNADAFVIESDWLGSFKEQEKIFIEKNKMVSIPIKLQIEAYINANDKTQKGLYVFNVCVFKRPSTDCVLGNIQSTYDKKIRQITIKVV